MSNYKVYFATGETTGLKLEDKTIRNETGIYDLSVGDDDVIAVPRRRDRKVYFYQLHR
jgi:hypothetical protein